jgi:hypothetical protein
MYAQISDKAMATRTQHPTATLRERGSEIPSYMLRAYPNLRTAAHILGVNVSSLTKRKFAGKLVVESVGPEDRVSPTCLLELAEYYRRRDIHAVAFDLLELAHEQSPEAASAIEEEIDAHLSRAASTGSRVDPLAFLREAKRALDPAVYERIAQTARSDAPAARGLPTAMPGEGT